MINPPAAAFDQTWQAGQAGQASNALASIGRAPATGGYHRHGWDDAEAAARAWFRDQADRRDLPVEQDGNGDLWAWWGDPHGANTVVTGSRLDSVPDGGAYDGALGVLAGFLATGQLDARARDDATLATVVEEITNATVQRAGRDGTTAGVIEESRSPAVRFGPRLTERLPGLPRLETAAGHDAGVPAASAPATMLFVRNPTGASHTPAEHAGRADCLAGIETLTNLLAELVV